VPCTVKDQFGNITFYTLFGNSVKQVPAVYHELEELTRLCNTLRNAYYDHAFPASSALACSDRAIDSDLRPKAARTTADGPGAKGHVEVENVMLMQC
jgi:hypothetical protein